MLHLILNYGVDLFAFVAAAALCAFVVDRFVRAQVTRLTRLSLWTAVALLAVAGITAARVAHDRQRVDLQSTLAGLAPTYAAELANLKHYEIKLDTSPDDPHYLQLIERQKQWLRVNAAVNDIYTMRLLDDGEVALIVDSETDYDRDGVYSGEREARTEIGERYPEVTAPLLAALHGTAAFDDVPFTDRWGTWVSAYAPLRDPAGNLDGLVGLDLDAAQWVSALLWARCSALAFASVLIVTLVGATALIAVVRADAQQRKLAAEQLRESKERFELAIHGSNDGIWDWHVNTNEVFYSARYKQLLGYAEDEFPNTYEAWESRLHPDDRAATLSAVQQHLDAGAPYDVAYRLRTCSGEYRWFRTRAIAIRDENGKARRMAGSMSDISALKSVEQELRLAARLDKLTALPNRALLLDRLQHHIERFRRSADAHFALMFLDFDRFKLINDSLGHKVGDALLRAIADRLRQQIRAVDSVSRAASGPIAARLGGDEFVVLLDDIRHQDDVFQVAERLLEALAKPYRVGEHEVVSTASVGIVMSSPEYAHAEDMLRDADTAMYEAKRSGKARYVVFDASMRLRVQRRLQLENDLRKAIELNQLSLVYQPIVSLKTGSLSGVEALLRWEHPDLGPISPAEFVPIAEDIGLIVAIGEWVLRRSCRQMVAWKRAFAVSAPDVMSINLSHKQFLHAKLSDTVCEVLAETQLAPGSVQLEVTEGTCMLDAASARQTMHAIKALGVRLAIDDFGTGLSSLASLHQFPVDVLKIDRSFVARVDEAKDIASLIHAAALLARNLGMATIAEGIEKQSQVLALQELGCEYAQGYFFGRPMPASELEELLRPGFHTKSEASGAITFTPTWSNQLEFGSPGVGAT